ncbi:hypothetical protein GJW-30_1_02414 [Variibacter gotjawalensis]|uniref:Uncharacterized protein n=1 Tax=Variibacter gotjawalensis TaxID=1333996 RepID=A0A0S3PV97_9BRAD|nr:hypothetical protein [Variibacter gotjawalensis]NIK45701.1 hypothetical protein [Variibacter gotjawalensis]RZS47627.1 hypothetical protein EV661_0017 [Variibacter gotjawalensis]BAT59879.1 hypothetical protein GJW-30_1_02414 [Variibacter gotjawalensis]
MADKDKKRDPASGAALYEAERVALLARTEKLRALRLAREAEEAANAPVVEPKVKTVKAKGTAKKKKEPAGKLSDWMKSRSDSGHNS